MKHPESEKIRAAMNLLEKHVPEKHAVSMEVSNCYLTPECGTVACFAGFYALAKMKETGEEMWVYSPFDNADFLDCPGSGDRSPYSFGYDEFGKDIGIAPYKAQDWAATNPDLWGNEHGLSMFFSREAYGGNRNSTITLYDIIAHWRGVADRIEAAE